jgi:hypothetical protein
MIKCPWESLRMKEIDSDMATARRVAWCRRFSVVGPLSLRGRRDEESPRCFTAAPIASIVATGICGGLSWICVFPRPQARRSVKSRAASTNLSDAAGGHSSVIFLHEKP